MMAEKKEKTAKEKPKEKSKADKKEQEKQIEKGAKASKKRASAKAIDARISLKSSRIICNKLRETRVSKSKKLLEGMIAEKRSLNKKYYTKTVKKILELLVNAEANAASKGLDKERLFIYMIKADKGRTFNRPRSKMGRRGERAKMSHIEIVLGEK